MTIEQLEKRNEKANGLRTIQIDDTWYYVESSANKIAYKVMVSGEHKFCNCADYSSNIKKDSNFKCKHLLAILNSNGNIEHVESLSKKPKLDERFITNIQGKDFVLYAGLLDLAHQRGLLKLDVHSIQYPTKDNGYEAICQAVAHSKSGEYFSDIGDANPNNTSKKVVNHVIRMASTRAKARVLRDMTNIGITALEELGDIDELTINSSKSDEKISKPKKSSKVDSIEPAPTKDKSNGNGSSPSQAQLKAIENLAKCRGIADKELEEMCQQLFGTSINNLISSEASDFIKHIQQSA